MSLEQPIHSIMNMKATLNQLVSRKEDEEQIDRSIRSKSMKAGPSQSVMLVDLGVSHPMAPLYNMTDSFGQCKMEGPI